MPPPCWRCSSERPTLPSWPRLFGEGETLHAPHLLDVEVSQVLRCYAASGALRPARAREALDDLAAFPIERYEHVPRAGGRAPAGRGGRRAGRKPASVAGRGAPL